MNTSTPGNTQLALGAASGAAQPSQEAAAAEKAAAEKAAAEKAAAEKAAAEKAAEEAAPKKERHRRGPPADGGEEPREVVILTTSKLTDAEGGKLRRGQAVSVPVRRMEALKRSGKIRKAPKNEIEAAERRFGLGRIG